ncbi:trypsin-like peptidase domain-containing protein [Streptomyces sp. NPDC093250]|uniref:VMAP-C domain-containing protein n=1 Tax=Streptomyces sp. NPDC093250 TaxID=3366036 RepID=UPI00382EE96A
MFVHGLREGSGFFVAPGFVVSCAHVAGAQPEERVTLRWRGDDYEAVICAASEEAVGAGWSLWPYPDLAILELVEPPEGHPCVWLDGSLPETDTPLTAVGFTDTLESYTASERRAQLTSGGRTALQGHPMLEIVAGEINLGLSGGPVLSHASGGVCAVVKATRQEDSAMGGFGTPVDALRCLDPEVYSRVIRAHDRFHQADNRWHRLSDRVETDSSEAPSDYLSRAEDRQFLDLLATMPSDQLDGQGTHTAAFLAAAAPGTQPPDRPLVAHRDVYAELAARMLPEDCGLPYQLAYCADLAREADAGAGGSDISRKLHNQVLIAAGRLQLGQEALLRLANDPSLGTRPSVIGMMRHSLRDRSLYHVMVWRYRSQLDIVPAAPESPGLPLQEGLEHLAQLLTEQIDVMGGMSKPGLIELILPSEVLDEDFADWKLWPSSSYSTLGRKQQVVVRPLERHETPHLHHAWEQRWQQLENKPVGEALVCVCGRDRQQQATLDATFNNDPTLAALALAGSPRSGPVAQAYEVAVASGVPVMMWLRGADPSPPCGDRPCGIPGRDTCPDHGFLAQARRTLADTERDALPERICALRNAALTDDPCADHIGERVVMLWDDPGRRVPRKSLAPAASAEEGRPNE